MIMCKVRSRCISTKLESIGIEQESPFDDVKINLCRVGSIIELTVSISNAISFKLDVILYMLHQSSEVQRLKPNGPYGITGNVRDSVSDLRKTATSVVMTGAFKMRKMTALTTSIRRR